MQGQIRQRVPSFNVKGYRSNAITDDLKNIEERQQGKHATVALTKRIKVVPAANLESVTHFKRESRILPRKHYPHKALPPTRNTSLEVGLLAERLGLPLSSRHLQAVLDCQSTTVAQRDKATKKKSWKKRWLECWQWTSLAIWAARRFQMLLRRK